MAITIRKFSSFETYPFIKHGFSGRKGGFSTGFFNSLNMSFDIEDDLENVRQNCQTVCDAIGIDANSLVYSAQGHGTVIKRVDENDKGRGITRERGYTMIDGLITNVPGVPLLTLYADCVPLFFLDPIQRVVGLAHAGWKGTVAEIAREMVKTFSSEYGSNPGDLVVGIGPSIGPCCCEMEQEVYSRFEALDCIDDNSCMTPVKDGRRSINLWEVNRQILISAGVRPENISILGICTKCHKDEFFSYRGDNGKTGRQAAIIELV